MPRACLVCLQPALPGRSRCAEHDTSWSAGSRQSRGYGASHDRMRARVLREEPVCRRCGVAPSTDMDHVIPRALAKLYGWPEDRVQARSNLQGLCHPCHEIKTAADRQNVQRARRLHGGEGRNGPRRLGRTHGAAVEGSA